MSERWGTPLYRLKTPAGRVEEVLAFQRKAAHSQAEGLDSSAAGRVFGYREETIWTWVTRGGEHAARIHKHFFHHLLFSHMELDELRTTLRDKTHELWVWVALDARSKVIPVLCLGGRTQEMAHVVIHGLCQCLMPGCIPLFTSDGLDLYFYALTGTLWGVAASSGGAQAAVGCGSWAVLRSGQEAVSSPSAGRCGVSRTAGGDSGHQGQAA